MKRVLDKSNKGIAGFKCPPERGGIFMEVVKKEFGAI